MLVEVRLSELAAERATSEDIEALHEAAQERAHATTGQYLQRGIDFHLAIASAAHHDVLAFMLNAVSHLYFDVLQSLDRGTQEALDTFRSRQQGGHDRVRAMIEAQNPKAAGDVCR